MKRSILYPILLTFLVAKARGLRQHVRRLKMSGMTIKGTGKSSGSSGKSGSSRSSIEYSSKSDKKETERKKMKSSDTKSLVSRKIMKGGSMSKLSRASDHAKSQSMPDASMISSMDDFNSAPFIEVTGAPGVDTSLCTNAIPISVGEGVNADATFPLDTNSTEACVDGFELDNPFVEVLGMWFQVPGTGSVLRANSCPAVISIYQGTSCDNLSCADEAEFNAENCQVEWTSSEVGQMDYILVQNIEFNDGENVDLPIRLTVTEVEIEEQAVETNAPTLLETNAPTLAPSIAIITPSPSQASVSTPDPTSRPTAEEVVEEPVEEVDEEPVEEPVEESNVILSGNEVETCQGATEVSVGETLSVTPTELDINFGICSGLEGGYDMDGMEVQVLGAYFTVLGTGGLIRASACPARIAILSGGCNDLSCTEILSDQFGCQMTWQTENGRIDTILVQILENQSEVPSERTITLSIEDPMGVATTMSPTLAPTGTTLTTVAPSTVGNVTDEGSMPINESELGEHFMECRQARSLIPGEINVIADASVTEGTLRECEGNFPLDDFGLPVLTAWFSVSGAGGTLRASACPHQLTLYRGSCNDLECVDGEVNEFGCEIEWTSTENQEPYYIVVQTFGFEGEGDDFVLPVSISINEPDLTAE